MTADANLNYEPPAKLGHSETQKLVQNDGFPAAGWVSSLKKVGTKLVASFKGVPKKLGEIIKAGGYKKVSSEIYSNYEIGGKKYPCVLKAVSFLGADIPAVKTLQDIVALYGETLLDEKGTPYDVVLYSEMSLEQQAESVREAFRSLFKSDSVMPVPFEDRPWIRAIFSDHIIAEKGKDLYKITTARQ